MTIKNFPEDLKVGVLMGGMSNEREVSLKTGSAVLGALSRLGVDAIGIDVGHDLCGTIREAQVDVAFIALHGAFGEDGCVQGFLEIIGVPYTGAGVTASAVAIDKALSKTLIDKIGIDTPNWQVVTSVNDTVELSAPVAVKPNSGGSSIGITLCDKDDQIKDAVKLALAEDSAALIEEFIDGKLITVGIVAGEALPVIEIEVADGFYDFNNKYEEGKATYHLPARVDESILNVARGNALKLHNTLDCGGVSRSEFIVDGDGRPWMLELNTIPGMTETSLLPKAAKAAGLGFDDLVASILEDAVSDE